MRFSDDNVCDVRAIRLPVYPAQLVSFVIEDVECHTISTDSMVRIGTVILRAQAAHQALLIDDYLRGFDGEVFPGAGRPTGRHQNIALGIYARGGNLQQTGSSGALKSLTMFDAMRHRLRCGGDYGRPSTPRAWSSGGRSYWTSTRSTST